VKTGRYLAVVSAKQLNGNQMTVDSLAASYHHVWLGFSENSSLVSGA
jgi:hypothetical protein